MTAAARQAQMKRLIAMLEEAKALAVVLDESNVAELIQHARNAALDRVYPAAKPFIPLRKRPVTAR